MAGKKNELLIAAKNKLQNKGVEDIPLDDKTRRLVFSTIKRKDVLIVSDSPISDTNDDGVYKIVDTKGNVLFEVLVNPYTIRLLQQGKVIARCGITVIRGELDDEVKVSDENMDDLVRHIYLDYEMHHSKPMYIGKER